MIDKFADGRGRVFSEFLDLTQSSNSLILVSLLILKFAPWPSIVPRQTSESGHAREANLSFYAGYDRAILFQGV